VEEANLSRNIFMLRKALGETAQDHRYIVTVPGRGYRLAEHVHLVPGQEFAIAAASHSRVQIEVKETKPWKRIESLATIQEHNTPLAEATTPSLEALEAYSAGWKLHTVNGTMAALPLLKRAVAIDPNFALAQATLAREYANLDESDLSAESATRAWQARDHASDREKFYVTATYEGLATGNLEAARQNDEAWAHTYPP
jgi:hypothetical protein